MHPVIRPLQPPDLAEVVAIEQASYPFPWTRGIFEDCLRVGYSCQALVLDGRVAGYTIHNYAVGEAHLLNLCVRPESRQAGLGRLLLDHAIALAKSADCDVMFLEVRPSNAGAVRLYERRGFTRIGTRPAYYPSPGGREDAVVMRLDLGPR